MRAIARACWTMALLLASGVASACMCGTGADWPDLDDLARKNTHIALVRVANVELVEAASLHGSGREQRGRLYSEPYQPGGAVAKYRLIEHFKGKRPAGLPRVEYMVTSGCTSGVAAGDFLMLFWDGQLGVIEPSSCEPRLVNLGPWLGRDRLMLADLREHIASGRPMHACDLLSKRPSDDAVCAERREQSIALDKNLGGY